MSRSLIAIILLQMPCLLLAQNERDSQQTNKAEPSVELEFTPWSGKLNIPDPVAISFDNQGRAYLTQTMRRKSQDLDIRQHSRWIPDDVGFRSVDDKRNFYHRVLAPGQYNNISDMNGDGRLDYTDLRVLSEKIHRVEDTDQDGTADRISLFADDFRTEVTGIAAGVLWHDDTVYTTIAPDVWKLRDTNGDGKADEREILATGFGLHIAYAGHDMHGLTVGPDGKIYWSIGDKGISATSREGKKYQYPNQGGVMRCNPDGSDFEVFAHGLRNVQELAFDEYGNLFGVDNDADQPGERERIIYIVEGMDAGWRCNYQYRGKGYNPWTQEKLWVPYFAGQAGYITPPIAHSLNGPAGFTYNPGTALSPEYRNYFFVTGAPGGEQRAFQMIPDGATFKVANDHMIGKGIPLVGINFGPDGALYGVDWGGGYPLNQKGAIWKIDVPGTENLQPRRQTQKLLADGFSKTETQQLNWLLADADQRVRLGAQFELVKRNESELLESIATDVSRDPTSRIHAIWGLGQLVRLEKTDEKCFVELLQDQSPEIRTQALRTITDFDSFDGRHILPMLDDSPQNVRFHAALALRRHHTEGALEALVELAAGLNANDTYLRHAAAMGLSGSATGRELADLSGHESVMVRLIAVIALRQQYETDGKGDNEELLGHFLNDDVSHVSTEAARAIYETLSRHRLVPGSFLHDFEALASTLGDTRQTSEPYLRRAIGAAYFMGTPYYAECVARYARRQDAPRSMRLEALNALAEWNDPPLLDRVDGRRRYYHKDRPRPNGPDVTSTLLKLFGEEDAAIRTAALKAARSLEVNYPAEGLGQLAALMTQPDLSSELRREILDTLQAQSYLEIDKQIALALKSNDPPLRMHALEMLREKPGDAFTAVRRVLSDSDNLQERQHAVSYLASLQSPAADELLAEILGSRLKRETPSGTDLELLEAARSRAEAHAELANQLQQFEQSRFQSAKSNPLAPWSECLTGGDAETGKEIFMTHISAACVRCHRIGKTGNTVGPDLEKLIDKRKTEELLRSIVDPNAEIEQKYRSQTIVLDSGKVIQGLPIRKDDKVTVLANAQGKEITVNNDEIDESLEQKTSIMPDMTKTLTRREIRNLVAYLESLRSKK